MIKAMLKIVPLCLALVSSPCLAADDFRAPLNLERQSSAFAGAAIRLNLGKGSNLKPSARLQLGAVHELRGSGSLTPVGRRQHAGLELGLGKGARPEIFLGGRSMARVQERLSLDGRSGSTVAIVFGVALLAVGLLVISNLDDLNDGKPASN